MRVNHEVLYTLLPEEEAKTVMRALKGCTLVIPRWKIEHMDIIDDYEAMARQNTPRSEIVKRLAVMHDRSKYTIREVLRNAGY